MLYKYNPLPNPLVNLLMKDILLADTRINMYVSYDLYLYVVFICSYMHLTRDTTELFAKFRIS